MIIDCHTHVLPPRIKDDRSGYVAKDAGFALIYGNKKAKIATADDLIDSMDRDGVDVSVIANYGWSTPELCLATNDYIMESVARYPKRLVGFGTILPSAGKAAIAEIGRCARGGIKGIGELRLDTLPQGLKDNESWRALFEAVQKYKLILLLHASEPVGHIYSGKGAATPDMLYPIITAFPDMTIICAHWGGGLPFYALMPEVKAALQNVYFDTAASPFLYHPRIYNIVSQLIGPEKILFGSDYPLLSQKRLIQEISAADLSEESKELILSGNARRLLGIEA